MRRDEAQNLPADAFRDVEADASAERRNTVEHEREDCQNAGGDPSGKRHDGDADVIRHEEGRKRRALAILAIRQIVGTGVAAALPFFGARDHARWKHACGK